MTTVSASVLDDSSINSSEETFKIVHQLPGRVRIRVGDDCDFDGAIASLQEQITSLSTASSVTPHAATKSAIVQFNPGELALQDLLERVPTAQPQPLQLPRSTEPIEQVLIRRVAPLITGYAAVRILGVSGWLSLPVFILSDLVTREALKPLLARPDASPTEDIQTETQIESVVATPVVAANGSSVQDLNGSTQRRNDSTQTIVFSLKHTLPGRLRYQVPRLMRDQDYREKLVYLVEHDRHITAVKLNPDSGSITVHYGADAIELAEMQARIEHWIGTADAIELPTETALPQLPAAEPPSANPWQSLTLPVATLGVSALWSLGLPIPPVLVAGTVAIAALPIAQRAIEGIVEEKKLTIDFLDLAAIVITTFQGNFLNPAIMIGLIEFGEAIREQSARSSKREALDLLSSLEDWVWVERKGEKVQISIQAVEHGETVIVYPGEQIPVDGQILRGSALVDEQKLTGEAMPVLRQVGQMVYASTLVREGSVTIRAERLNSETRAGQILKVMQDAPVHDTRIGNYAAEIADRMVIPTLLMSAVTYGLTGSLARAASVLTLDFATGIRVSVPTTVLAALTYAARRGILIRSGRTLEQLAQVDAVVFDKTGTLTQGEPIVVSVETVGDHTSSADLLGLAAAAEQHLTHPVAEAVVRCARERGVKIPDRGEWDYQIGLGVRAEIDGQTILVGSRHFMEAEGVDLMKLHHKHRSVHENGHSVIYVAASGHLRGAIAYRDPLRPESREVISSLRRTGNMEVHLLTGDNKRTAASVAHELGIATAHTYAEAFPEHKVAVVRGLHTEGKTVAFVGDGINDSPALAHADVSVSLASGSDVARETADVVLMENNLHGLPEAIAIARQAMQLIGQNTSIVAIPNLSAMLLAVTVGIPPLAATLVNNGSTIIAGLNGLRPLLNRDQDLNLLATSLEAEREVIEVEPIIAQPEAIALDPEPTLARPELDDQAQDEPLTSPAAEIDSSTLLSAQTLAQRLQVSIAALHRRKTKPTFSDWSRERDPASIAWSYLKQSKQFARIEAVEAVRDGSQFP